MHWLDTIHGISNLAILQPYPVEAIGIEKQNLCASGEEKDTPQFWIEYDGYRDWQKGGQVLAGAILGTSVGPLFGIVYAKKQKSSLPGKNDPTKSICFSCNYVVDNLLDSIGEKISCIDPPTVARWRNCCLKMNFIPIFYYANWI